MYQDLHFYIDLNWEQFADSQDTYLKEIYQLVEIVNLHQATIFYSQEQIQFLKQNCSDLDENFIQSHGNMLELILKNAIPKIKSSYFFEINFAQENTSLNCVNNYAISSVVTHQKIGLLSVSEKEESKKLLNVKSNQEFEKIEINSFGKVKSLLNWIHTVIPNRTFNLSKKHGENGLGNWKGESALLCSAEEAQSLLNNAIPDFNKSSKQLYNFDDNHETFIEFYYEGDNPQRQWHGFHIKKEEWEFRIPKSIRKFFQKNI